MQEIIEDLREHRSEVARQIQRLLIRIETCKNTIREDKRKISVYQKKSNRLFEAIKLLEGKCQKKTKTKKQ